MFMEQTEISDRQTSEYILGWPRIEFERKLLKFRMISVTVEVEVLGLDEVIEDIRENLRLKSLRQHMKNLISAFFQR